MRAPALSLSLSISFSETILNTVRIAMSWERTKNPSTFCVLCVYVNALQSLYHLAPVPFLHFYLLQLGCTLQAFICICFACFFFVSFFCFSILHTRLTHFTNVPCFILFTRYPRGIKRNLEKKNIEDNNNNNRSSNGKEKKNMKHELQTANASLYYHMDLGLCAVCSVHVHPSR